MKRNADWNNRVKKSIILTCILLILMIGTICYVFISGNIHKNEKREEKMSNNTNKEWQNTNQQETNDSTGLVQNSPTLDMAETALDKYLESFYVKEEAGGYIVGEDFWQQAEIFEVILDACEQTKDKKYLTVLEDMYQGFVTNHGEDWSYNEFNDDIMWMTIACARAYLITGDKKYLNQAEKHFNLVYDRAWSEDLGGGLFWKTENKTKNSCINCPAVIAACLLREATGDKKYMDKALLIYQWEKENLFGTTGAVFDAYDLESGINTWCSTYNQGTFIGAAMKLYQYSGDETYLEDAKKAADYTVNTMFSDQVMNTEGDGNDLPGFKGILARWMGKFVRDCHQYQYTGWLNKNAMAAWSNQNSNGIMWTLFYTKTEDTFYSAWGCSAAVSMLINCPKELK
ncbi:glycoside hydrolase family 76 protein [Anaerocolumna sp. AGMB13025]|uniref:glycoside hydrolase family 76 protein n=1 Tax=Anaerocolumna sp. AGMB13025 TaxID=3039116 RepID=UPI0024202F15|nr:glycoside hydrolase family 76 protein [Anaerocolumna sp. AGMB13025]WFR57068.1 glycoside hydrolase family 76 protein [Anaerocolumna sp. AGMB13025]